MFSALNCPLFRGRATANHLTLSISATGVRYGGQLPIQESLKIKKLGKVWRLFIKYGRKLIVSWGKYLLPLMKWQLRSPMFLSTVSFSLKPHNFVSFFSASIHSFSKILIPGGNSNTYIWVLMRYFTLNGWKPFKLCNCRVLQVVWY